MFDKVRVYFKDETTTTIYVGDDDHIGDAIVELCQDGDMPDVQEVAFYCVEGQVEGGA